MSHPRSTPTGPELRSHLIPTALEMHSGVVLGLGPIRSKVLSDGGCEATPRVALEQVLLDHLARGSCVVQFSGGRDSSLVLATAVAVARRHGLTAPSALSVRYDDDRDAEESEWQDLVAHHLGVELQVVQVARGDNDLCSSFGLAGLRRHGVGYPPPAVVNLGRIAPQVAGRAVLTGEGGDEVLGPSRATVYVSHWRRRHRPSRAAVRAMVTGVLPASARRALVRKALSDSDDPAPWLRPEPAATIRELYLTEVVDRPWRWDESKWSFLDSRLCAVAFHRIGEVARGEGFEVHHPLMDLGFVAALARAGGTAGLTSRTEAMRLLAGDLLPEAVLTRRSKATFNDAYAGMHTRAFAQRWDGSGVDPDLVDPERLREAWLQDEVPAGALPALLLAVEHDMQSRS